MIHGEVTEISEDKKMLVLNGVCIRTKLTFEEIITAITEYERIYKSLEFKPSIDISEETVSLQLAVYNSLLETKGRYEEIKVSDEENKDLMDEYKELLVIKGKYEELSNMFANQESTIMPKSESPKAMLCTDISKGKKPEVEVETDILNCAIEEPEVEA